VNRGSSANFDARCVAYVQENKRQIRMLIFELVRTHSLASCLTEIDDI
jgi:hypothetical protein